MYIEHQCNFFHIYHNHCKIIVVTFQCKLLLGVHGYHHLCKKIQLLYDGEVKVKVRGEFRTCQISKMESFAKIHLPSISKFSYLKEMLEPKVQLL